MCVPVACPLCYNLTNSLPGYTLDPNNCAKFYSCVKYDNEWFAYHMNCPNCTFWDQDLLTCVQVDTSCLASVSVATDPGVTAQGEVTLLTLYLVRLCVSPSLHLVRFGQLLRYADERIIV